MKKLCKNIDITDRKFISEAVYETIEGKYRRRDVLQLLAQTSGLKENEIYYILRRYENAAVRWIVESVVDRVCDEIIRWDIRLPPISYRKKVDGNSGKVRLIGIENIYQQIYEHIAVRGLAELSCKFGEYQVACIKGRGPHKSAKVIKRWLRQPTSRWAWKADAKQYYPSIDCDKLKKLLGRYVKNKPLLRLTYLIIDAFEKGLSIGSYLSQFLANFYMSFAYHFAAEKLYKIRHKKNGTTERVNLIDHVMIQMDDILFIGSSLKDVKSAAKQFKKWVWDNLRIEIKPDEKYINLMDGYIDMVGFFSSKKKVIVRSRNFVRFRRDIMRVRRTGFITIRTAKSIIARNGWYKGCQCRHFMKRNKVNKILKKCREVISNGKDVFYYAAARSDSYRAA